MEQNKQPVKYEEFSKDEQKMVQADIDAVLSKHNAEIVIAPVITPQGTIGAMAQVFKKVNVEAGTPSPAEFLPDAQPNGGTEPTAKAD